MATASKLPATSQVQSATQRRFIKLASVKSLTTLSTSEIYRRIGAGKFPQQIMLGPKSAVWIEGEVIQWCEARIAESRGEAV
ncbi:MULTISPECIES: helix-turn-helix transcriptional regulator [Pseudomonas]|uniref:helix-turn-helix transcriptional regulator n=1 Tax=Pseudomonas TaxID=286 RepID=UPI000A0529C1|nr:MULTISPECIES: AlpA family phage regulatory protein [Pseudomonas]NMZ58307.1 AlpA family phage regulatory protein [Pseudomonas nitroreducens]SNS15414.1 transcriptional regulator, AlpA family [Pseudomonas nitroreducens]